MNLHAVILAGGRGERFWPLSRRERPKQLLALFGDRSLLRLTVDRLEGWIPPERRWVVAPAYLMREIREQTTLAAERCVEESVTRNTAAAIGAAALLIEAVDPAGLMLVLPSDHWMPDARAFREDVERAARVARERGGLHLFGIPPSRPETGFGYIEEGPALAGHDGVHEVVRFHEKPDRGQALAYAARPDMLWNSGIFLWAPGAILEAIKDALPSTADPVERLRRSLAREGPSIGPDSRRALAGFFEDAPSTSIDHAVLERHGERYVTRARFRWSDLGSWLSWGEQRSADSAGNRVQGAVLARDAADCVLYSADGGLLALLGARDLVVVRLNDVTLVCPRERAQDLKSLLRDAESRGDLEKYL
ncbi:MAG: mannose-1-phosphate guanylyltransferase [Candidatus Eisenbacteria bacterium]|nr:mannose-1-phosphate guanylyltransferase [Candidatus Eisenbacteria bacterium]